MTLVSCKPRIIKRPVGIVAIIWFFCSGLYLTKLLPVSPVHLAFILSLATSCLILFSFRRFLISKSVALIAALGGYFLTLLISTSPAAVLNVIVTFLSPLLVYILFKDKKMSSRWVNLFFLFHSGLFICDAIYRILNPAEMNLERLEELGIGFQIYKINTFMYMDSNFVGLQAVSVLSFYCWLSYRNLKLSRIILVLLLFGVFFTFSRAAILSSALVLIITFLFKRNLSNISINILTLLVGGFFASLVLYKFATDVSFMSKFHIIDITLEYLLQYSTLTLVFGVGIGNAKEYLGIGAHNLFVTFLVETGFIGLFIFLALLLYWFAVLRRGWLILVFPFLLSSMSLGTTAIPYLFTMVTVAILVKRNRLTLS